MHLSSQAKPSYDSDHSGRPWGIGELKTHAGVHQHREGDRKNPMLDALMDGKPLEHFPTMRGFLNPGCQIDQLMFFAAAWAKYHAYQIKHDYSKENCHDHCS